MSIRSEAVTVTTSATTIATGPSDGESDVLIYNDSDATVYLGGSDVTSSNGLPVVSGASAGMVLRRTDNLYGITASGSKAVRVLETRA